MLISEIYDFFKYKCPRHFKFYEHLKNYILANISNKLRFCFKRNAKIIETCVSCVLFKHNSFKTKLQNRLQNVGKMQLSITIFKKIITAEI